MVNSPGRTGPTRLLHPNLNFGPQLGLGLRLHESPPRTPLSSLELLGLCSGPSGPQGEHLIWE